MDIREMMELIQNMPRPGCSLICTLRTVEGNNLNLLVPNVGSFNFLKQELRDFADEHYLPISLFELMNLVEQKKINCPSLFLLASLTALSLGNGYGSINVEYPDKRAFIGTFGPSYRICTQVNKSN